MNPLVATLIASMASVPSVVEQDGVKVEVSIRAQQYVWEVHNLRVDPITAFRVAHSNCYNPIGPPDWTIGLGADEDVIVATTPGADLAIHPGSHAEFAATVSSNGAVLGVVPMTLTLADGTTIDLEVWGPAPMPRRAVLTVVLTLCGVAFLHARIVDRRQKSTT